MNAHGPLTLASSPAGALTRPASPLIGRRLELDQLTALCAERGSLTAVVGPPGVGKTALARAVAERLAPDGAFTWLGLERCASLDALCAMAVARVRAAAGPRRAADPRAVAALLAKRGPHLLVLDAADEAAEFVAALLGPVRAAAPELSVLVASRGPLRPLEARPLLVAPLRAPAPGEAPETSEAVQLLLHLRGGAWGEGPLDAAEVSAAAALARRLNGLPLAMELVACQPVAADLQGLLARFDEHLRGLPQAPGRGPLERCLLAAASWAASTLDATEREFLQRCAMFASRFAAPEAEARAPHDASRPPALQVAAMIERRLLRPVDDAPGHGGRALAVDASVRAHLLGELSARGALAAARERHARALAACAPSPPEQRLYEVDELAPLLGLRDDLIDAVGALAPRVGAADALTPLVAALDLLTAGGSTSAAELDAFGAVLARGDVGHHVALLTHALQGRVRGLLRRGRLAEAGHVIKVAMEAPALRRASWLHAALRECEGGIYYMSWLIPEAVAALEDACALALRHGDALHAARISWACTLALMTQGRLREATVRLHEAAVECALHGDLRALGRIESSLGAIALEEGRLDAAAAHFERAIAMGRETSLHRLVMTATGYLGVAALAAGRHEAAVESLDRAAQMARAEGQHHEPGQGIFLSAGAAAAVHARGFDDAVERLGAARRAAAGDVTLAGVVALYGAHLDLSEARRMLSLDDPAGARARWRAVLQRVEALRRTPVATGPGGRGERLLLEVSDDARVAMRILERQLALDAPRYTAPPPAAAGAPALPTLVVAQGGAWFARGETVVHLKQSSVLRRLLWGLCEHRARGSAERLPLDELLALGWGDQRLPRKVVANRLYVAISELRRLGLRDVLRGDRSGYALEARVEVSAR